MPHPRDIGPGEGWIDIFGAGYVWMEVYDRRAEAQIPVVLPPSGSTQPLVPDSAPVQIPTVVPGPGQDFNNTQPPPLVPIGTDVVPTSAVADEEGETVALDDWVQAGIDIYQASQAPAAVWQAPAQFAGTSVPTTTVGTAATANGLPAGMYMDKHGHLVHRRRRRRPCITQTDLSLAWQISNLPNNANVKMFLAKCVR